MGKYLEIAIRNLVQSRRRSLLLSMALAAVTLLLVLLMSLSQGIRDNLILAATAISTGHVNVTGFYKTTAGEASPILTDVSKVRQVVDASVEGVDFVVDRQNGWGRIVSASDGLQTVFKGVDIEQEDLFVSVLQLAPERDYKEGGGDVVPGDTSRLRERGSALLFANQAKRLQVGVGDVLTIKALTFSGVSNTAEVTVVAIAKDLGILSNFHVFVDPQTLLEVYQLRPDTSGSVMIYLDDLERADTVLAELRVALEEAGFGIMDYDPRPYFMKFESVMGEDWTGQKLDLTTWKDETSLMSWVLTAVDTITFILISVLTVIIVIGIMNTMWISVRERTRELGTLRAIGMSRRQVLALFMLEAMVLGLVSTTVGALAGAALAWGIDAAQIQVPIDALTVILMSDTVNLSVQGSQIVTAIVVFSGITALSAAWPSLRASRLQPVTAMHHVE